jgi:hypothetical protein
METGLEALAGESSPYSPAEASSPATGDIHYSLSIIHYPLFQDNPIIDIHIIAITL